MDGEKTGLDSLIDRLILRAEVQNDSSLTDGDKRLWCARRSLVSRAT